MYLLVGMTATSEDAKLTERLAINAHETIVGAYMRDGKIHPGPHVQCG